MVGAVGGEQILNMGDGCQYVGLVLHEFGHAIGFYHEHNRPDRDDTVEIMWDNIQYGKQTEWAGLVVAVVVASMLPVPEGFGIFGNLRNAQVIFGHDIRIINSFRLLPFRSFVSGYFRLIVEIFAVICNHVALF